MGYLRTGLGARQRRSGGFRAGSGGEGAAHRAGDADAIGARDGDESIPIDGIADHLHNRDEEFLVDRETAERVYGSGYYYSYPRCRTRPYLYNNLGWVWEKYGADSEAGWDAVETVFIRSVLAEGLYWLGLLDLGYMRSVTPAGGAAPAGIQAVRLTDMGRWLLLDGPRPTIPAETGRVVVQPNFHVFAFDPISDAVLARLDSFATRLKAERAVEYEITRESISRAQQNGQQVGRLWRGWRRSPLRRCRRMSAAAWTSGRPHSSGSWCGSASAGCKRPQRNWPMRWRPIPGWREPSSSGSDPPRCC